MIRYSGVVKFQWKFFVRYLPTKQKKITYLVSYTVLSPNISPLCLFKEIENNFSYQLFKYGDRSSNSKKGLCMCTYFGKVISLQLNTKIKFAILYLVALRSYRSNLSKLQLVLVIEYNNNNNPNNDLHLLSTYYIRLSLNDSSWIN